MQVTDATVRFSRTIQVREYEPASAEVTLKAQLEAGEDAGEAAAECFKISSEQVHLALGLAPDTKLPTRAKKNTAAPAAAESAKAAAESAKAAAAPKAKPAATPKPSDDIPGESAAAAPAAAKTAAASSDIPDNTPAQATAQASDSTMTPAELSKWIGEQVKGGKTTSVAVQGLYPKFGITRFADLKPDKVAEAKKMIEELIAGTEVVL